MRAGVRVLLLGVLLVAVGACNASIASRDAEAATKGGAGATPGAPLVIPVRAQLPQRGDISGYTETTTQVEAERRVDVNSQAIGLCDKIYVQEGDHVHKGEALAKLDTREAEAAVVQAQVQAKQQESNLDRTTKMHDQGLSSDAELDNAKFGYEASEAALKLQQIHLDNMTIRAPINGIVTKRNIQIGMLVTTGIPVFSIVDPSSYVLNINPPEKQLDQLSIGQTAKVTVDSLPGKVFTAHVCRISPAVESGNVKVTLSVAPAAREKLREGTFARVRLVMETHKNALLVPKDAVVEENSRKYLFLAKAEPEGPAAQAIANDTRAAGLKPAANPTLDPPNSALAKDEGAQPAMVAKRVEIKTGLEDKGKVEVLSGLSDNDLVIVRGQQTLKPDARIRVTTEARELKKNLEMSAKAALQKAEAKRKAGSKAGVRSAPHRRHRF